MAKYQTFKFDGWEFDNKTGELAMRYSYQDGPSFAETAKLPVGEAKVDDESLNSVLQYLYIAAGTSYYKAFVSPKFDIGDMKLDKFDAELFNQLYRGGLSQHLYENKLPIEAVAKFKANIQPLSATRSDDEAKSILLMASGGKDSLLSAELLKEGDHEFKLFHISSTGNYPPVLDKIGKQTLVVKRTVDTEALSQLPDALNGHVPFSAIIAGYGLVCALLNGQNLVLAANESSADEANVEVDGMSVNHQYSKTWAYEKLLSSYLVRHTGNLDYASHLRRFSELKIAELFANKYWHLYGHSFSSCNLANYKQGTDGRQQLVWDGRCSKCANAWLLFAPFINFDELSGIFGGKNLSEDPSLNTTFRQLLGVDGIKPFECVGTVDEMKQAYRLAVKRDERYGIKGIDPSSLIVQPPSTNYNENPIVKELYEAN